MSDLYVVVEFNQASGMPTVWHDDPSPYELAVEAAADAERMTAERGRRERYRVCRIDLSDARDRNPGFGRGSSND